MNKPTTLLIDNSNTRTKFMLAAQGILAPEQRIIPTAAISAPQLEQLLGSWHYERVLISSVVPETRSILCRSLRAPKHILGAHSQLNFDLSPYAGKHTLGADRLANAAGLIAYGQLPAIAVDLGTAVTYEVLQKDGHKAYFAGGLIAAGLQVLSKALHQATAQLPAVETSTSPPLLAQDTQSALQAGAFYGYMGMVRETLTTLQHLLGEPALVVLTGGDARHVHAYAPELGIRDDLLTMKGLCALASLDNSYE